MLIVQFFAHKVVKSDLTGNSSRKVFHLREIRERAEVLGGLSVHVADAGAVGLEGFDVVKCGIICKRPVKTV